MKTFSKIDYSDLIGKSFKYGGRGPLEYDCYGLAMEIYRRLGVKLPDFGSAVSTTVIDRMITEGRVLFHEITNPCPWCLVLFRIRPPFVTHIGVVLDGNRFIHVLRNTHVCTERLDNLSWKNRIAGYLIL